MPRMTAAAALAALWLRGRITWPTLTLALGACRPEAAPCLGPGSANPGTRSAPARGVQVLREVAFQAGRGLLVLARDAADGDVVAGVRHASSLAAGAGFGGGADARGQGAQPRLRPGVGGRVVKRRAPLLDGLAPAVVQPGVPRRVRAPRPAPVVAQWELGDTINVVLFAGLGGTCQGLEEAGLPVHVANNHDEVALAAHAALHPYTAHVRGSVFDVDPLVPTSGRRVGVLWASPDCTDHSAAKGGAPRSPRVRSLPWQVLRWAGETLPQVIFVENVRELRGWGGLVAKRCKMTGRVVKMDGSVAAPGERVPVHEQQLVRDPKRQGRSFRAWKRALQDLGYAYEDRDLNCADYGVPTTRRRFFAIARRDGRPIRWPERTHAPRGKAAALGLRPWVPASSVIDWGVPIPSVFGRKRPLAEATLRRIAAGLRRFVLECPAPFVVPSPAPRPRQAFAYVAQDNGTSGGRERAGRGPREPLSTITTGGHQQKVVAAYVHAYYGEKRDGESRGAGAADPAATLSTSNRLGVVAAFLAQTGYGERPGQAPRALDLDAPLGTQVAGGAKHTVCAAWIVQHNGGEVGQGADRPVSTLTTAGSQQQVGAALLAKLRGTGAAQGAGDPVSTPSLSRSLREAAIGGADRGADGNHVAAVAAFLTKYYGRGVGQDCGDPLHTAPTKDRFGVVTVRLAGETYAVMDVGMRMLEPREAAAAHELRLPDLVEVRGVRRPLTKREAMRLVGNSVPKRMARLIARANRVDALCTAGAGDRMAAD